MDQWVRRPLGAPLVIRRNLVTSIFATENKDGKTWDVGLMYTGQEPLILSEGKPLKQAEEDVNALIEAVCGAPEEDTSSEMSCDRGMALKRWRLLRAKSEKMPAYCIMLNTTLAEIVKTNPQNVGQLASIPGMGETRVLKYGEDILRVLKENPE